MTQTLIFESVTEMRGTPPDVPLASGISLSDLTAGDDNPMFVTLQIGEADARSRNDRQYPRDVEMKVVEAINQRRVGGIRGHLRDDERSSAHPEMVWRWVGAMMDAQGRVWGKAYVLPTQAQAREEIRTAKAANANVGTSRYATGTVNGEGIVEAEGYFLEGIDYVHEARVGIPQTSVVPMVTPEAVQEAGPNDLSRGDFVEWNSSGGRAQGQIERVERNGTINVPDSSFSVEGTPDDPAALIQLYRGSEATDTRVGHKFSTLTKIQPPSQEAGADDEMYNGKSKQKKELVMTDDNSNTFSLSEVQERVNQARTDDRKEITRLSEQLSEAQKMVRDWTPVMEQLGNPKYPDMALRAKLAELDNLKAENEQLLNGYIEAQVAKRVKSEAVRPMIRRLIAGESPATRAEVDNAVQNVLSQTEVKQLLKAQTASEAGPAQPAAQTEPADEPTLDETVDDSTALTQALWN